MTIKDFLRNRRGNFGLLTALVLPLALFGTGAAVDYGLAVQTHQKLRSAAQAAVLGAVSEAQLAYIAQENVDLAKLIETSARDLFNANIGARFLVAKLIDSTSSLINGPTIKSAPSSTAR